MILLLVASLAVLVAATSFSAAMPPRGTLSFLASVGLLTWAIVITTVLVAGLVLRTLDPGPLLALAVAWAVVALAVAWQRRAIVGWPERPRAALAELVRVARWLPVLIPLVLVLGTLAWRTVLALRLPVVDYDGWSYHLVFADVWLQHNAIVPVLQRPWTAGYPANGELFTTWLMAFTRSDAMAGFTSLLPVPLAIVVTMGLARELGASRRTAAFAGLVFGMTPALVALTGTSYVDAASVAAVIATWWFGLRVVRGERDRSLMLLLGIAAGLAIGTKGTNVLLVGVAGAAAAVVVALELVRASDGPAGKTPARLVLGRLALLALPVLVLGLSWYLKNLVAFGNPMYPFALGPLPGPTTLADFQLAPPELEGRSYLGKLAASWTWDWHTGRYPYNIRPGGLGRAWPLIILGALAGVAVLARRRRIAPLALVALPAFVTLVVMPMNWYARLTLFLPALGLALLAVALGSLPRRWRAPAAIGLVAIATISLGLANIRPNFDLRPQVTSTTNSSAYVRLVLGGAERRTAISLRASCAEFDRIPAGARVAPGGFNLLHGVVGHDLSRVLTETPRAGSPAALVDAVRALDATWLVTNADSAVDRLARGAPGSFVDRGETCQGARIWEFRPGG